VQRLSSQQSSTALAALQEEHRKYRIRCETLLRQKDDEIDALVRRSKVSQGAGGELSARELEEKLNVAEARIQKLVRSKTDLQEQVGAIAALRVTAAAARVGFAVSIAIAIVVVVVVAVGICSYCYCFRSGWCAAALCRPMAHAACSKLRSAVT
jgi:Trp operon repressor